MVRFAIQCALLLVVCWLAWRRGGLSERLVATALSAQLVVDQLLHFALGARGSYWGLHLWHFPLDLALFAVILTAALKADRWWVIWAGSAQFLAVLGHILRAIDDAMFPITYAIMERLPFWLVILLAGYGTITRTPAVARSSISPRS
ncbi:hypothetical protein [Qipengyuania soli]|uniref:Uncharacterized protein n=1 Tax=Qipengyuania soli TaxID=2782568 RepID=A0A7S8IU45_9SPHN|nr:hypothetical protein [Qipengyuania soli]QPC98147.1 hypothetical protein IRL76_09690 [Qipengyuania soli]